MRALPLLLGLLLPALPGCGNGTIADLFSAFPPEVFQPPDGGGGGLPPGTPPPGGFTPQEVGFLEAAQGVTGNVRNVALAQVGARTIAFLSAGTSGCHMVDVTQPELTNSTDYITTIRDAVLSDPSAALAGGQVDAVTVVDNTYLVCVAVGTPAANGVTVFHIPTLLADATSSSADLSGAFLPGTGDIAVPGNAEGKAGGVDGGAGIFVVATGGSALGVGLIDASSTPGSWTALPPVTSAANPVVDEFLDVRVAVPAVYASVRSGTDFGIIALNLTVSPSPSLTIATPNVITLTGNFDILAGRLVAGPGNFPLDLAVGAPSLFVSGDDEVRIFSILNPVQPVEASIVENTGVDTIAVAAGSTGFFAVGAGDRVRVYTTATGRATLTAELTFPGTFVIRGVALQSSAAGRFVLCCAGNRGLRIVQWSDVP